MRVYTIGFIQKSAAEFFEMLRNSGAKRLVDVRLNNVSQLSGFAKGNDLEYFLDKRISQSFLHPRMGEGDRRESKSQVAWQWCGKMTRGNHKLLPCSAFCSRAPTMGAPTSGHLRLSRVHASGFPPTREWRRSGNPYLDGGNDAAPTPPASRRWLRSSRTCGQPALTLRECPPQAGSRRRPAPRRRGSPAPSSRRGWNSAPRLRRGGLRRIPARPASPGGAASNPPARQ